MPWLNAGDSLDLFKCYSTDSPYWNEIRLCGRHTYDDNHYSDVIMGAMASQITSRTIVYSTVWSLKHQSSGSLAFVRGIHRWPVNSPHKGPVTRKMFPFDDVMITQGFHLHFSSHSCPHPSSTCGHHFVFRWVSNVYTHAHNIINTNNFAIWYFSEKAVLHKLGEIPMCQCINWPGGYYYDHGWMCIFSQLSYTPMLHGSSPEYPRKMR